MPDVRITGTNPTNFKFDPKTLSVPSGATVKWTNQTGHTHTVTSDNGAFDSGNISPNGSFTHVFNAPGSFAYHCNIHPGMTGTTTVT